MSLSPLVSFKSRFVTYLLNFPRIRLHSNRYMSYRFFLLLASGIRMELIPLASSQQNPYDIYLLLCIQYQTPDDGQKTCPEHVQFCSKNRFEKLVHLFGCIIRIQGKRNKNRKSGLLTLCVSLQICHEIWGRRQWGRSATHLVRTHFYRSITDTTVTHQVAAHSVDTLRSVCDIMIY